MSDSPGHPAPAASPVLGYLTDNTYRPTGELSVGVATTILCGSIAAAAFSALITFFWFRARLPTQLFLPFFVQASVVAFPLAWMIRRLKVNNLRFAVCAGIVSGASCVVFFYFAQYVQNVYVFRDVAHRHLAAARPATATSGAGRAALAEIDAHPFAVFDRRVIFPRSGIHGFPGYLIVRGKQIWIIGSIQAACIAWLAVKRGRKAAGRPLCANCRVWFNDPINAAVVPVESGESLSVAIEAEDLSELARFNQIVDTPLGTACAVARIYTCPECERHLAEVVIMTFRRKNRERIVLAPRQISSEAAAALRGRLGPVQPLELNGGPNV